MKLAAVCLTYKRPQLIGRLIECFLRQMHQDAELVILDDAGQYRNQGGGRWQLVSVRERFPSVAAKRNAAAQLVSPGVEAICQWDDDDIYLPWALAACSHAFERTGRAWVQPRQALEWAGPGLFVEAPNLRLSRHLTWTGDPNGLDVCYGGQWCYRADAFRAVGGYRGYEGNGEDIVLAQSLYRRFGPSADTICGKFPLPWYVYTRKMSGTYHTSEEGPLNTGYERLAGLPAEFCDHIEIGWPLDYAALPIPTEVKPRPW